MWGDEWDTTHRRTGAMFFVYIFFSLLVAVSLNEVLRVLFVVVAVIVSAVYRFVVCVNKIVFEFWALMKNNTLITTRQMKDYSVKACDMERVRERETIWTECILWREHTHKEHIWAVHLNVIATKIDYHIGIFSVISTHDTIKSICSSIHSISLLLPLSLPLFPPTISFR